MQTGSEKSYLIALKILAFFFLGAVLYSNILHAPFVFDDYSSIVDNETIKDIKTSLKATSNSRYLTILTFAFNYYIGGLKPFGYHLMNNLIHAINAILVYYLVILTSRTPFFGLRIADCRLRNGAIVDLGIENIPNPKFPIHNSQFTVHDSRFIALFSALLFVSHPIQTQAVTYIVQRATSMVTMFYLFSLVMYIRSRLEVKAKVKFFSASTLIFYSLSVISAILAMKTKEIALTLPFIIILYEFCFFSKTPNSDPESGSGQTQNLKRFLYLLPIILTVLVIPLGMLDVTRPVETIAENIDAHSRETPSISRIDYLLTQFRVIVTYLRLLVFPANQSLDYRYPLYHSFFDPQVFLSFLVLLLILGIAVYIFYRSRLKEVHSNPPSSPLNLRGEQRGINSRATSYERLIAFGIFWFFITLAVESSIIPIRDVIVEHRVYLPSIGFFMALVTLTTYLISKTKIKIAVMVIIVALLSIGTYNRNVTWKDEQTLWEDVLTKFPNNVRAHVEIGAIFRDQGEYNKAIEQLEKALKINQDYAPLYYNLGEVQYRLGNYENAIIYFKKALELKLIPHLHMDIFNSLGITYSEMGDDEKAVSAFKEAIQVLPFSIIPYNNLGRQYIKMGRFDLAIEILEKGLKIREEPHLRSNLSAAYAKKRDGVKNAKTEK